MAKRVHTLAKELGVKSKAILEKCQAEGLDIKNHMSVLSAGLEATVREWFSEGEHTTTAEAAGRVDLEKVKAKPKRRRKKAEEKEEGREPAAEAAEAVEEEKKAEEKVAEEKEEKPEEVEAEGARAEAEGKAQAEEAEAAEGREQEAVKEEVPAEETAAGEKKAGGEEVRGEAEVQGEAEKVEEAEEGKAPVEEGAEEKAGAEEEEEAEEGKEKVKPVGREHIPAKASLKGPRVVRVEQPEPARKPSAGRGRQQRPAARGPVEPAPPEPVKAQPRRKEPHKGKGAGAPKVAEDEARLRSKVKPKGRTHPRRSKSGEVTEEVREWRERDLVERRERISKAGSGGGGVKKAQTKRKQAATVAPKKEEIKISEPIVLKEFCSATGIPFAKLFPKLMELGVPATINQTVTSDQAELLSEEFGVKIEIVKQKSRYEELVEKFEQRERKEEHARPPIVTFLGHVDHGKTSILDRLRHARVAQGEAGGITQHVGAYRYQFEGKDVVFLDTPGHEAFTSMRARGAQMTDIVVLVIAADDGVMPQTIEAINHAKAANVSIVVALNKIDLPNVDLNKIYGQLSEYELTPTEWGGETDVIKTSAVTGIGMDELVEHLSTLAELLELKAYSDGPATGNVIESRRDVSRGPVADLMIREGTLGVGDVIVVGKAYGRIRALFNDLGNSIESAGPATPVEVLGLNEVPGAGDKFYGVEELQTAKDIAEEKSQEDQQQAWAEGPKVTLENIFQQVEQGELKQLNVIVRGDTQGSVDVLKSKLEGLSTSEVQVRILHAGTGGIREGDIILAEASDAVVIGFGVIADESAKDRAEELGVEIRTYTVIYHLLEEMQSAIEGLLEPTYEMTVKGRALVREVFRITRVGSVAGCQVTDGVISRSSKVRVIRQNVIVRDNASLESLKRFKEDAKEVRKGYECGIKIANFDDIKEGDIIEAYEMVEVARKLEPAGSSRE